jgi:hypothetical protein
MGRPYRERGHGSGRLFWDQRGLDVLLSLAAVVLVVARLSSGAPGRSVSPRPSASGARTAPSGATTSPAGPVSAVRVGLRRLPCPAGGDTSQAIGRPRMLVPGEVLDEEVGPHLQGWRVARGADLLQALPALNATAAWSR